VAHLLPYEVAPILCPRSTLTTACSLFLVFVLLVCWLAVAGWPWHIVLLAAAAFFLAILLGLLLWTRLGTE
jgi:hypothetical protein